MYVVPVSIPTSGPFRPLLTTSINSIVTAVVAISVTSCIRNAEANVSPSSAKVYAVIVTTTPCAIATFALPFIV